ARQLESDTQGQTTAAEFMKRIYDALQPETRDKLVESAKDPKSGEKYKKVLLALRDQANHPLDAKDVVKKSLKKAETAWYKRLWRPRPDRIKIFNSFNKLEGKDLLEQWSNFREFLGLHKGLEEVQKRIIELQDEIDRYRTAAEAAAKSKNSETQEAIQGELDRLYNQRIRLTMMGTAIQQEMSTFVLGIRQDRHEYLLRMTGLVSEDRLKLEAMLTEKIISAAESDPEVMLAMAAAGFPFDQWMKSKMRGVDAIEMQRYLDTTRQWHLFSNKGAQLDEATRRVVGSIRSGNVDIREAEKQGKSPEELQGLKSKYSQKTEEELQDRKQVEAAFKDMQAKFNARASLIIRIITTILVLAVSAAVSGATMGAATPIMIGVNAALLLGQIAVHAAFDYFVLKKPLTQVAIEAGVAILQTTLNVLALNLATALNASFLHPDLFLKGAEWIAPNLSKALSKTIVGILMAYPKTVLKMAYEQRALEEVVEKGKEKAMGKELLKNLAKGAAKPWLRFVLKSAMGGAMYGVEQAKGPIYESIYGPRDSNAPPEQQPAQPSPEEMVRDPGKGVQHVTDQMGHMVKSFLTPQEQVSPPKEDFLATFVSAETFNESLQKVINKQPRKLKKQIKKEAAGKRGGWLVAEQNQRQRRKDMLGQNRERMLKGMKLVEDNGIATKLGTGVTTLTPNVRIVYFGGGWRLEDTGTPQTAQLNGQPIRGAVLLQPGDFVTVGATKYRVQLGAA
ncbi:MAG TPA: FHA domain-containing protein, partial [Caldilineaceae bacterium]|nr:FHA domain-containing protein [Caldilineaceae bacterium]